VKFVEILEVECEETEDSKPAPYIYFLLHVNWLAIHSSGLS
jgi:hypothetical protein